MYIMSNGRERGGPQLRLQVGKTSSTYRRKFKGREVGKEEGGGDVGRKEGKEDDRSGRMEEVEREDGIKGGMKEGDSPEVLTSGFLSRLRNSITTTSTTMMRMSTTAMTPTTAPPTTPPLTSAVLRA